MDYTIFNPDHAGQAACAKEETEQAHMERVLRDACGQSLHEKLEEPGICDLLAPEFYACDAEGQSVTLAITVKPWMLNPKTTLHGGMMAAMLDTAMGLLVRYYGQTLNVSTFGLSVIYLRPAHNGERLLITARADKRGRRVIFTGGEIALPDGRKIATATASFMI